MLFSTRHSSRTSRSRAAVAALVLSATGGVGLLGTPAQATPVKPTPTKPAASSCAPTVLAPALKAATTVVVATVTQQAPVGATGDVALDVVASRLYKGTVADPRMGVVAKGGSETYWSGAPDQKLLLVIDAEGRADLCDGSRVADAATIEKVQARLGVGQRLEVPLDEVVRTPLETSQPQDFARLAAPGGAVVLLALLALAVVNRVQKH